MSGGHETILPSEGRWREAPEGCEQLHHRSTAFGGPPPLKGRMK